MTKGKVMKDISVDYEELELYDYIVENTNITISKLKNDFYYWNVEKLYKFLKELKNKDMIFWDKEGVFVHANDILWY